MSAPSITPKITSINKLERALTSWLSYNIGHIDGYRATNGLETISIAELRKVIQSSVDKALTIVGDERFAHDPMDTKTAQ